MLFVSDIRKKIRTLKHRCLQKDFDSHPWGKNHMSSSPLHTVLIAQLWNGYISHLLNIMLVFP